jgi:nicotinate-nucleotide pyrophosphorylase (carboxylating)
MIARISGPARGLLSAERVALNYLMHLSGIATHTARFADAIAHTRQKSPAPARPFRACALWRNTRCAAAAAPTHRYGLDDAILIKDNHIAVAGGIGEALKAAKAFAGHLVKIEIEVDTLEQFARCSRKAPMSACSTIWDRTCCARRWR